MPRRRWKCGGGGLGFYSARQIVAIHESGHACAAVDQGIHVHRATIAKSPGLSGKVEWRLGQNDSTHSKLFVVMAGPIAEHYALGMPCSFHGHAQDNQIIRGLVGGRYRDERKASEFQRALLAAWSFVMTLAR